MERWIVLFIILGLTGWWLYKATRKRPVYTVWGTVMDVQPSHGTDNFFVLLSRKGARVAILEFEIFPIDRCRHKHGSQCFHGRNDDLKEIIKVGNVITVTTHDSEESRVRLVHRLIADK